MKIDRHDWICVCVVTALIGFSLGWFCHPSAAPVPAPAVAADDSMTIPLPDGRSLPVPKGSTVRIRIHDTPTERKLTRVETGTVKGAGMDTTSDKIASTWDSEGLGLSADDDGIRGTVGRVAVSAKLWAMHGANIFLIVGLGLVVGGMIVLLWLKIKGLGLAMLAAGGVAICVGVLYERAAWLLVAGGVAILVVAVWWFLNLRKSKKTNENLTGELASTKGTLTDVVISIEKADETAKANGGGEANPISDLKKQIAARTPKSKGHAEIDAIVEKRDRP